MDDRHFDHDVDIPAGGWGSAKATTEILLQERAGLDVAKALFRQNKHELEDQGRLTEPLEWDAASDRYVRRLVT